MLKNKPACVRERLRQVVSEGALIALSSVVLFELWYGVARSGAQENGERLRVFLSGDVGLLPFEDEDAVIAGNLRCSLEMAGTPVGPYDLLIAAQALRAGAMLATANVSEFARVPGLVWQDWTIEP